MTTTTRKVLAVAAAAIAATLLLLATPAAAQRSGRGPSRAGRSPVVSPTPSSEVGGGSPSGRRPTRSAGLTRGNAIDISRFRVAERERRIINGKPVFPGELDSGAGFLARFFIDNTDEFYCMGALVTYRSILTAAHCFHGFEDVALADDVRIGGIRLYDGFPVDIEKIVLHPDYNPTTFENDVAVITIKNAPAPARFERNGLVLARLGYRGRVNTGTVVRQSGWGATNVNVTQTDPDRMQVAVSPTLLQQTMVINNMSECNQVVQDVIQINEVNNPVTHLCGSINDNVAICSGDSGSPVFTKSVTRTGSAFYYVEGIVSFSYEGTSADCVPAWPDFYSRVSHYYFFIRRNLSYRYTLSS
ncbi:hypothetical protein MMPV_001455 [Pyropia vietnamensis]